MGLLSRKPKRGIEDFCQDFYDSQLFHAVISGVDLAEGFWERTFMLIAEADPSFESVDRAIFRREMTALKLELFGLAWMHCFRTRGNKYLVPQSVFTRDYLYQHGQQEIWEVMWGYNRAIADSREFDTTGKRRGQGRLVFMDSFRLHFINGLAKDNANDEYLACVARVGNRFFTGGQSHKEVPIGTLTVALVNRLGCDLNYLNNKAVSLLAGAIFGLYKSAREDIQRVDIVAVDR